MNVLFCMQLSSSITWQQNSFRICQKLFLDNRSNCICYYTKFEWIFYADEHNSHLICYCALCFNLRKWEQNDGCTCLVIWKVTQTIFLNENCWYVNVTNIMCYIIFWFHNFNALMTYTIRLHISTNNLIYETELNNQLFIR